MTQLDKQFPLILDGLSCYVATIAKGSRKETFRMSTRGETRGAYGLADYPTEVDIVTRGVLEEDNRVRYAPEDDDASSLDLNSRGVTGHRLDVSNAAKLGLPTEGGAR